MSSGERENIPIAGSAPTLSLAIVECIQNAILRGDYPPGSALPEIPLSRKFESSRTTVREALRSLNEMGLVVLHSRRGATVASLTPKRAREIFSLRALLESYAVKLGMTEGKINRHQIEIIEDRFEQLRNSVKSGDAFRTIEADMAFHWALCCPCDHKLLLEQLRGLQTRTRQFIFFTKFYDSDVESEIDAHSPIIAAVRAYEADRAEAAVRDHIMSAGERLLVRMLEESTRDLPAVFRPDLTEL
jgi:DNA-binding GntR family transcriptional regulator